MKASSNKTQENIPPEMLGCWYTKNNGQILTLIGIYCTLTGRFASGCDIQDSNLKHGLYKYPHNNLVGP